MMTLMGHAGDAKGATAQRIERIDTGRYRRYNLRAEVLMIKCRVLVGTSVSLLKAYKMTVEHPIVFLVCTLTVIFQLTALFVFRYNHRKGKKIAQVFIASTMIILMVFCGIAISILTDSGIKLTIILTLSLGFIGAFEYLFLRLFKFI